MFAQTKKSIYIFNDDFISYKEYVALDRKQVAETNFYENSEDTKKLYGKKAKHGVLILKSQDFIDSQMIWFKRLNDEISRNSKLPKLYLVNGIMLKRSSEIENWILTIPFGNIEYINYPKNKDVSDTNNYRSPFIEGSMVIIWTKKWIELPFR